MSSIQDFKGQLINGGFRPNQFRCFIVFPTAVAGGVQAGQKAQFLAKSAQLPSSSVDAVTVSYRGRPVKFAGERTFQPWSIEVYTDTDFNVRNAFENWIELMQNARSTSGALIPAMYQVEMQVQALDRNDRVVKTYKFVDAFPTEVGAINLSWDDNNTVATFGVNFEFNYFETV
jgi:T4-like virus tail tube protein gp19